MTTPTTDALPARKHNAIFHAFRQSGKWYSSSPGYLSPIVYEPHTLEARRRQILRDNGGRYPGLIGCGSEFIYVVIPDETVEFGFPLMLKVPE